jgi:hypothetical protein
MPGQPTGFDVVKVIPTEPAGMTAPALVVQLNDSITLKAYMHVPATVPSILRTAIRTALTGATPGKVEYHLQDLETGAMVPTIAGGTIIELTATSIPTRAAVLAPGGDLEGFPDAPGNVYFLSRDTAPITTGNSASAATLKLAAATSESGTWRVLTHTHGPAASEVSAFDDDLLIQVIT